MLKTFPPKGEGLYPAEWKSTGSADSLTVVTSKKGKIEQAQPSRGFPESQLQEINKKIVQYLLQEEVAVGQEILFCRKRVSGAYRYKNLFQIMPVPENAPVPAAGSQDYPFILQFSYKKSLDGLIDYPRRREKATIYTRLLNIFCDQKVRLNRNNIQFYWTLDIDKANNKASSSYRQEGYAFDNNSGFNGKQFSDISKISEIQRVPFQDYYSRLGSISDPLEFPETIDKSLYKVFSLSTEDYERFFRACTWYEKARDIWLDSNSSAFVALVSAIEALIEEKTQCNSCHQPLPAKGLQICPECKQPKYQATKHFKDFLKKYYPALSTNSKGAAILYSTRSWLAHGVKLLQQDLKPWSFGMNPINDNEDRIQGNLLSITRIVIYNWLWSR